MLSCMPRDASRGTAMVRLEGPRAFACQALMASNSPEKEKSFQVSASGSMS